MEIRLLRACIDTCKNNQKKLNFLLITESKRLGFSDSKEKCVFECNLFAY